MVDEEREKDQARLRVGKGVTLAALFAYLAAQSFTITVIPLSVRATTGSAFLGTLALLAISVGMLVGDLLIRRVAAAGGQQRAILSGILVTAAGILGALTVDGVVGAFAGAALAGAGLAMTATPLLAAYAVLARDRQVSMQGFNAVAQRAGAMFSGVLVGGVLGPQARFDPLLTGIVLLGVTGVFALAGGRLAATALRRTPALAAARASWSALIKQTDVRVAMLIAASVVFLTVVGGAVLPLAFTQAGTPEATAKVLVAREVWALIGIGVLMLSRRKSSTSVWLVSLGLGGVGLVIAALSHAPAWVIVGSSVHGAAIGIGIVVTNVLIYEASKGASPIAGFSLNGLASRVASILTPGIFALVTVSKPSVAIVTSILAIVVITIVVGLRWRKESESA